MQQYGFSATQVSLTFTFITFASSAITVFGIPLKKKLGVRGCVFAGALCIGAGLVATSFMQTNIWILYLGCGVGYGLGNGFISPVMCVYNVQLWPEKSGIAASLSSGAFSLGSFIWSPIATAIFEATGKINYSFRYLGLAMFIVLAVSSLFLKEIPADFTIEAAEAADNTKAKFVAAKNYTIKEMLRDTDYYLCFVGAAAMLSAGVMVFTYCANIVEGEFNLSIAQSAIVVSLMSVASIIGRLTWGAISDRIGKRLTACLLPLQIAICLAALIVIQNLIIYVIVMGLTVMGYGAVCSNCSPLLSERFGERDLTSKYSLLHPVFFVSGLIGPVVISSVQETTGRLTNAYLIGIAFCALAETMMLMMYLRSRELVHRN